MIFADLFGDLSHGDRRRGLGTDMMAMITKHASFAESARPSPSSASRGGRAAHFSSSHLTSLGSVGPALSHALLTAAAAVRAGSFNSELKGTSPMRAG